MLEQRLAFTLTLFVDFIDADLLVPRRHGQVIAGGGKAKIGDAVFWWRIEGDVFGDVASGVGLAGRRRRADGAEERHLKGEYKQAEEVRQG